MPFVTFSNFLLPFLAKKKYKSFMFKEKKIKKSHVQRSLNMWLFYLFFSLMQVLLKWSVWSHSFFLHRLFYLKATNHNCLKKQLVQKMRLGQNFFYYVIFLLKSVVQWCCEMHATREEILSEFLQHHCFQLAPSSLLRLLSTLPIPSS